MYSIDSICIPQVRLGQLVDELDLAHLEFDDLSAEHAVLKTKWELGKSTQVNRFSRLLFKVMMANC